MTKITQLNIDDKGKRRRIHLREISGDGETLDTVGQELRAARLRRGDDLATVSRALKIRKDHLEAVEEDKLESLPGKTYAIGFVRSYAGYLGLDAADMVERYKQEISGRNDDHMPTVGPIPDEHRRLPYGWRVVAGIVVLAVGYGAYHLLSANSAPQMTPPPPSLAPPKVAQATPKPVTPPPAEPVQTATPSPAMTTAPAASPSAAAKAPAPATPPSDNPLASQMPTPPANKTAAAEPAATPSPALTGTAATPAAATVYGQSNHNARVVLKATGDTHLMVRGKNGTIYINRNLKAGDAYQVPNAIGLTLSASNGGALEMDLDGQSMGKAGADQQSADDVPLDPQTIADRAGH
ncbi:MAG TPA: RodZ domain-containing protein [Rhizomicrobium sp.]|jgi:cytoskeleton protein RodZ|nr:RodZ domain-containing protein [Rhizomicrobium sp.]